LRWFPFTEHSRRKLFEGLEMHRVASSGKPGAALKHPLWAVLRLAGPVLPLGLLGMSLFAINSFILPYMEEISRPLFMTINSTVFAFALIYILYHPFLPALPALPLSRRGAASLVYGIAAGIPALVPVLSYVVALPVLLSRYPFIAVLDFSIAGVAPALLPLVVLPLLLCDRRGLANFAVPVLLIVFALEIPPMRELPLTWSQLGPAGWALLLAGAGVASWGIWRREALLDRFHQRGRAQPLDAQAWFRLLLSGFSRESTAPLSEPERRAETRRRRPAPQARRFEPRHRVLLDWVLRQHSTPLAWYAFVLAVLVISWSRVPADSALLFHFSPMIGAGIVFSMIHGPLKLAEHWRALAQLPLTRRRLLWSIHGLCLLFVVPVLALTASLVWMAGFQLSSMSGAVLASAAYAGHLAVLCRLQSGRPPVISLVVLALLIVATFLPWWLLLALSPVAWFAGYAFLQRTLETHVPRAAHGWKGRD